MPLGIILTLLICVLSYIGLEAAYALGGPGMVLAITGTPKESAFMSTGGLAMWVVVEFYSFLARNDIE